MRAERRRGRDALDRRAALSALAAWIACATAPAAAQPAPAAESTAASSAPSSAEPRPAVATRRGILLFGGTGRLGAPIAELLVQAGEEVTVFVRRDSTRERLRDLRVRYVVGDLADERSIAAAFDEQPYRAAIDASAQRGASNSVDRFYENAARWIVAHAKRTGVRQFILHGSIGAGANFEEVLALRGSAGSDRLADKGLAEQAVRTGGVPYTIIRHGLLPYDPQPPATQRAFLSADLTSWGEITRGDLAILTLDALDNPARLNRIYHAIDPQLRLRRDAGSEQPRSIGGPSAQERAGGATPVPGGRR